MSADVEACCVVLHDAYEAAAVQAGWSTQAASRKPWAEVPEANKATMRAAVAALLDYLTPVRDDTPWPLVVPCVLGWSNPGTGPESLRLYALDQGQSPRWARPKERVPEAALVEAGAGEGWRCVVVAVGDRYTDERVVAAVQAALATIDVGAPE